MAVVLILEDEANLRASMARGLSSLPGMEIWGAGSLEEALRLVDQRAPDLVLSDIDLPDRSGLELLGELGKRGLRVPVVYISAYLKAYGSQIPRHADVEVREKPIALEELRRLVTSRIRPSEPEPEAASAPFGASDYVQLACLGFGSIVIEVRSAGGETGRIVVANGKLWSASDRLGTGPEAFRRLVAKKRSTATCQTLRHALAPETRDLREDWETLLLAAEEDASMEGSAVEIPRPAPANALAGKFEKLWNEGVDALLAKDYRSAFQAFLAARSERPDDGGVAANLERLRQLGFTSDEEKGEEVFK